jgi:hypothetical protein
MWRPDRVARPVVWQALSDPGSFIRNRLLPLLDGSWALPMYYSMPDVDFCRLQTQPAGALSLGGVGALCLGGCCRHDRF